MMDTLPGLSIFFTNDYGIHVLEGCICEEVARESPKTRYLIVEHLLDQVCYIYVQAVLMELPAESITLLFSQTVKNPRVCNIINHLLFS